jgi:hypothetical protein
VRIVVVSVGKCANPPNSFVGIWVLNVRACVIGVALPILKPHHSTDGVLEIRQQAE